jgi:creatinine amidohydrolase/Fe(II)-dependent formamide hydrolase-like protein
MMLTWQNTAWDFKAQSPLVAILPLAGLEPHGERLPVGTDRFIVSEISTRVASRLRFSTFLLPTWPLGTPLKFGGQTGAITLGFETLWGVVRDIVVSLHEHDIHRVVVINNLGSAATPTALPVGNSIVKTALRQLNYENPGLTAIWVQPFAAGREALNALFPSAELDMQAGALETSILMSLAPAYVLDGDEIRSGDVSAVKGKLALDAVVNATVAYIEQSFDQLDQIKG